jgi:hypothetical protein
LHFAAESNNEPIVILLLDHDASPKTTSDGRWTALHNAAEKGHINIVGTLLEAGAPVNAELSNGMTALHWSAFNGHIAVVERILAQPETRLAIKDSFDRTPLICAAQQGHRDIVYLLSPAKTGSRLSPKARRACESFEATIVDFGMDAPPRGERQRVLKASVYDLLYGWDTSSDKPKVPSQVKNIKSKPTFRWIHIPANNVAWVEAMLTKSFVESGHRDIDDFKAIEKCFSQEHRGPTVHASFMRTFSQRIPPMSSGKGPPRSRSESPARDLTVVGEGTAGAGSAAMPRIQVEPPTPNKSLAGSVHERQDNLPKPEKEKKDTPKPEKERKKSKTEKFAERHAKKPKGENTNANKGSAGGGGGGKAKAAEKGAQNAKAALLAKATATKAAGQSGKIVLFVSFGTTLVDCRC